MSPAAPAEVPAVKPEVPPAAPVPEDPDDEAAAEKLDAEVAAVAKPVTADPIQIYGWREHIVIKGVEEKLQAKLDTGALTSSIHAEEKELFERDGKKWVRFIVTDPSLKKPARTRIEAPLVRIARIKEPGAESIAREVVQLSFQLGDRKLRGDFTLNNRSNMLAPVLIGRNMIKVLGWVDPGRTNLADQKIFR
ncbi:MAG: ATP-dependent zinc protease [Verrucomicrobiaceae bacterium]|nr:MAG: ATP-dependent zinc protease [Verrucomicrobiaceae bacterium]